MKIRTDFVSNSSSCSFVIQDIKSMLNVCKIFAGVSVPYDFDLAINIKCYTTYKNWKRTAEILAALNLSDDIYDSFKNYDDEIYFKKQVNEYPDEVSWDSFKLTFEDIVALATSNENELIDELCSNIDNIKFETDDYGDGPIYLAQLYKFYANNGCKPNDEDSEHSFLDDNNNKFIELLNSKMTDNA